MNNDQTESFWPVEGLDESEIKKYLLEKLNLNIDYLKDNVVGFPGTTPDAVAVDAFSIYMAKHSNNICTHTSGVGEKGFDGSHELEVRVIRMMGSMLGDSTVNGYLSSGGTESNIIACVLAREYFNKLGVYNTSGRPDGLLIVGSLFTHYSLRKASWIIGDHNDSTSWANCEICSKKLKKKVDHFYRNIEGQCGVNIVGTDNSGRICVEQISLTIDKQYLSGIRRFVIVSSEGNVMTGAMDDTNAIGELIAIKKHQYPEAAFYLHVDAAIGGFVWPFNKKGKNSFFVKQVDSITVDAHKMGLAPYPAGMFLYRRDERDFISLLGVRMGYVPGEKDGTLIGSRPGASAAACFAVMQKQGIKGYTQLVQKCLENRDYLFSKLKEIKQLDVFLGDINIVSWRVKPEYNVAIGSDIVAKYFLVTHEYPQDFALISDHVVTLYKATVMPHVTKNNIDSFVTELSNHLSCS